MHDTLDLRVAELRLTEPEDYAEFLLFQYRSRLPVESWAEKEMPRELLPPLQVPLIETDLSALGCSVPSRVGDFVLPTGSDPIGAAWALAGSSLGNRAMLNSMRKAGGLRADWPDAFLSDTAMTHFWTGLREKIEQPYSGDPAAALRAAEAVFARFIAESERITATVAA